MNLRERLAWQWKLFKVHDHVWNRSTSTTARWNADKPHRCPACHTIVSTGEPATWRAIYECCRCKLHFARWPRLARFLPLRYCQDIATGECPHLPEKEATR